MSHEDELRRHLRGEQGRDNPEETTGAKTEGEPPPRYSRPVSVTTGSGAKISRSELALDARAARERWPITDEQRGQIVDRMLSVLLDPHANERAQTMAARCLRDLDALNVERDKLDRGAAAAGTTHNQSVIVIGNDAIPAMQAELQRRQHSRLPAPPTPGGGGVEAGSDGGVHPPARDQKNQKSPPDEEPPS